MIDVLKGERESARERVRVRERERERERERGMCLGSVESEVSGDGVIERR